MHPSVTNVIPSDNYVLRIDFDNGERGTLDMKPFLDFGIFQRLKDLMPSNGFVYRSIQWSGIPVSISIPSLYTRNAVEIVPNRVAEGI